MIVGLITITESLFGEGGPFNHLNDQTINLWLYGLQSLTLLIPLFLVTRYKYKTPWKAFGFRKVNAKKAAKFIAFGYLFYYIASSIFIQLKMSYDYQVPGFGEQESHIPIFGETLEGMIIGGIIIIGIAPIIEELFFRGYIYQVIKKYTSTRWASVIGATIFALFHLEFQVFIPIFILGLVLNWIFEKSGSLWTPIAFHMINNTFAYLFEIAIFFEWIDIPW